MDYLKDGGDFHKYDAVRSVRMYGEHAGHVLFSIVTPTYRRADLLEKSLRSVLNQKIVTNYEIVVVDNDDQSDMDNDTFGLIRKLADTKIVYYRNEKNIGTYGNTLRAARLARGKYVVLLNDDDLLHPYYLYVMNCFLNQYGFYGVMGTIPAAFTTEPVIKEIHGGISAFSITETGFFTGCCVTSPGFLYPKEILEEIYNAYDGLLMGDQIMQYKALKKYRLILVDYPLAFYRIGVNETMRDEIVADMMFHMCRFKSQISRRHLILWLYMLFFRDNCYQQYVTSTGKFWHKEHLIPVVLRRLHCKYHAENSVKQLLAERIFSFLQNWFSRKKDMFYLSGTDDKDGFNEKRQKR